MSDSKDNEYKTVLGPYRTGKGGRYTTCVRGFIGCVGAHFGWGKDQAAKDCRLVYTALWNVETFHPSGCFSVPTLEIASFLGITERRVKSALAKMDCENALVYDNIRGLVFVPDIPVHNFHAQLESETCKGLAQNVQGTIRNLGKSAAVDACISFLRQGGVGGGSEDSYQLSEFSVNKCSRMAKPSALAAPAIDNLDLCAIEDLDFAEPFNRTRKQVAEALAGDDNELKAVVLADVLLATQERCGQEPDDFATALKFARKRLGHNPSGLEAMYRILARRDEGHRTGKYNWLGANSVFDVGSAISETTDGLVWKAYDVGEPPESWEWKETK